MHYWWSSVLTAWVLELVCCNWVVITMNLMLAPEHVPCHSSLNSSLGHCSTTGFLSNQPADWALCQNHSPRRAKGQEQAGLQASRLTLKAKKLLWDKLRTTVFWANSSSSFVRNSTDQQLALQTTRLGWLTAGQHTSKSTPCWQGNTGSMCYVGFWWQNSTDLQHLLQMTVSCWKPGINKVKPQMHVRSTGRDFESKSLLNDWTFHTTIWGS